MPTYEYQCGTCGNRFEKFQSFSDEPVKTCPECGQEVKKVFSAAGIIFKGSGWYINDSRKGTGDKPVVKADADAKSDAKPETTIGSETKTTETVAPVQTGEKIETVVKKKETKETAA